MTEFDDRILNDYLDGELSPAEVEAFEIALASDPELQLRVASLSETLTALGDLPSQATVPEAVWAGIRERTQGDPKVIPLSRRTSRTVRMSWSQLAAAAVVLVALTGSVTWFFVGGASAGPDGMMAANDAARPSTAVQAGEPAGSEVGTTVNFVSSELFEEYEATTSALEEILAQGAGVLSTETLEVVQQSLMTIDEAIAEARTALENDPGSVVLNRILTNNMKKKLELLTETAAAIQAIA